MVYDYPGKKFIFFFFYLSHDDICYWNCPLIALDTDILVIIAKRQLSLVAFVAR